MESFHEAAKNGHLDRLREATRRECNRADETGMTPTLWTAYYGNAEALRLLVSRGGDPNKCDAQGYTALHFAAMSGHRTVIEFLISFGCNYWALTNDYRTATQLAIESGKTTVADLLDDAAGRQSATNKKVVQKAKEKAVKEADERVKTLEKKMREEEKKMKKRKEPRTNGKTSSANSTLSQKSGMMAVQAEQQHDADNGDENGGEDDASNNAPAYSDTRFWIPKMNPSAMTSLPPPGKVADGEEEALEALNSALHTGAGDALSPSDIAFRRRGDSTTSDAMDPTKRGRTNDHEFEDDVQLALDDEVDPTTSALEIFLAVNNLEDYLPVFFEEDIDMKALELLTQQDIIDLKLPLGPRRKLEQAIKKRKETLQSPGPMLDAAV